MTMAGASLPRRSHGSSSLFLLLVVGAGVFIAAPLVFVPTGAIGASTRAAPRAAKVQAQGTSVRVSLPDLNPLPWAEDLEGADALHHAEVMKTVDKVVEHIYEFDQGLYNGMTEEQLNEYDNTLTQALHELEDALSASQRDLVRDSMEPKSESQVVWLEYMLQSIGDLRRQLRRVRDGEGKLHKRLAKTDRGFLQKLLQASAVAVGGHKAVANYDYPATGVSSYTGEPTL